MSLRTQVALLVTALISAAMLLLGGLVLAYQWNRHLEELELRARSFLSVLGVELTEAMASSRIEALDKLVTRLVDPDLGSLDIAWVAVLDPDNRVLAHTDQRWYGAILEDSFSRDARASDISLVRREEREGRQVLRVSMPVSTGLPGLPGLRWGTLEAAMGLEGTRAELRALALRLGALLLVTALLAAGLTFVALNRLLVRPVGELVAAARRFAAGSLGVRVHLRGHDEVALLGDTFNDLGGRIESYTRGLEEKVTERTRDLEETNQKLSGTMEDLQRANRRLEELATTDGLTGLFNHRHFKAVLEAEVSRSRRLGLPTALLMIDVDHFKIYNDTHGHPAGDQVLRGVAQLLRSRLRGTDMPCRYGGEEFAVILLDTGRNMALAVAEEIRSRVEATPFEGQESQPGGTLTVSIGVAEFPEDGTAPEDILHAADAALYQAKRSGRNMVVDSRTLRPGS